MPIARATSPVACEDLATLKIDRLYEAVRSLETRTPLLGRQPAVKLLMLQRAGNRSPVSIDHTSAPFVWQEGLFEYLSNDIQLGLEGKNISDFPVDYHGDADHKEELV